MSSETTSAVRPGSWTSGQYSINTSAFLSKFLILCRTAELDQSKAGISRLRAWVSGQGEDYLSEDDIVIAASVDEVLSPDTLTR